MKKQSLGLTFFVTFNMAWSVWGAENLEIRSSANFPLSYEANSIPEHAGFEQNGVISGGLLEDGWLRITTENYGTYLNADAWAVSGEDAYTVEIRLLHPEIGELGLDLDSGVHQEGLAIGNGKIRFDANPIELTEAQKAEPLILRYAFWTHEGNRYRQLWLNYETIRGPVSLPGAESWWDHPYFRFGQMGNEPLVVDIDYIRMDRTGAYAPEPFGEISPYGNGRYSHDLLGEIEFLSGDTDRRLVFSHSLQSMISRSEDDLFSQEYGVLQQNPWGVPRWFVSQFFGLVHFGEDGDQYAGWVSSERFGWMRFVDAGGGNRYLWVHRLQTWMAVNPDGSFHSFDFGWLVPEPGSFTRYNSRIGVLIDDEQNPAGWLRSDRFGFVWFAREGTGVWFWSSNRNEWIGITQDGGLWSTTENRFI
jgi:hypothetical protein